MIFNFATEPQLIYITIFSLYLSTYLCISNITMKINSQIAINNGLIDMNFHRPFVILKMISIIV